jgi:hypothetical protein
MRPTLSNNAVEQPAGSHALATAAACRGLAPQHSLFMLALAADDARR